MLRSVRLLPIPALVMAVAGLPGPAPEIGPGTASPAPVIREIRFEGNKRTRPGTLLREMVVRPGDVADPDRIEQSRQAIMDLELFRSVTAELRPDQDGVDLIMTIDEKRYLFLLPVVSRNGDGDWTFGAEGRIENLWGRNHRLELEASRTEFASEAELDSSLDVDLSYRYPRIRDGPWTFESRLSFSNALLEEDRDGRLGTYDRSTSKVQLFAARWWRPRGPSRGWLVGAGLSREQFDFRRIEGDPGLFFDAIQVGWLGQVTYDQVHSDDLSRSGYRVGYTVELFRESLGSSTSRLIHAMRLLSYNRVTARRHTNLNVQLRWQLATRSLFGDATFRLGGSTRLRGYERQEIEGEALILMNVEFLTPLHRNNTLRGVVFCDAGDAFRDSGHFTLGDVVASLGAGLRWRLRAFVNVDLRLDVARGFDEDRGGTTKIYLGTGRVF